MLKPNKKIYAIGLMSGTSTDGVDVACIELNSKKEITLLAFESYSYPDELKKRLLNIGNSGETTAAEISSLNVKVGTCFANSVLNLISKYHLEKLNLDFIGSHGQTISHTPKGGVYNNQILSPSTLQIGDPSIISELTGLTVISNMRTRDVAVGGTGAPLTPWAHQKLFENKNYPSAFLNLGGIANITFIPKAKDNGLFGFDCGPANMIIDRLVSSYTKNKKEFDDQGKIASKGKIHKKELDWLMKNPYLSKPPPKSTGREDFGEEFSEKIMLRFESKKMSVYDALATTTAYTAESICHSIEKFFPKNKPIYELIVGGGGAKNKTLMSLLETKLNPIPIVISDNKGFPHEAVEAVCFALLAWATIYNMPSNILASTGAKSEVVLGNITPGSNFNQLYRFKH
tara:strand:+ start:3680 stop:4882 length:1203 start_codon:yes stop_codon:yes gene_type:complete